MKRAIRRSEPSIRISAIRISALAMFTMVACAATPARAAPVHLACDGYLLHTLPKGVESYALSLAIDEGAGTVTIENYGPVVILDKPEQLHTVMFMARRGAAGQSRWSDRSVSMGSIDRRTGAVSITFISEMEGTLTYTGRCRPTSRSYWDDND
jgi:hypothetical protein